VDFPTVDEGVGRPLVA